MIKAGCAGAGESDFGVCPVSAGQETIVIPTLSITCIRRYNIWVSIGVINIIYSGDTIDSKRNPQLPGIYWIWNGCIHPGEIGSDSACLLRIEMRFDPH